MAKYPKLISELDMGLEKEKGVKTTSGLLPSTTG